LTAEVQPPEPPLAPASVAAGASTSTSSSAATEGDSGAAAAAPGGQPFSSQAPRGVRSHPSFDSEAMVDAALSNMLHDVDELPSLADLAGPVARTHTHVHTHSSLDIFDAF